MSGTPPAEDARRERKRYGLKDLVPEWIRNPASSWMMRAGRWFVDRFFLVASAVFGSHLATEWSRWLSSRLLAASGGESDDDQRTDAPTGATPPPPTSNLDSGKKAEMDYQAKLNRQGIMLDKLIFGVLIALVTASATATGLYLVERHREADTHQLEQDKMEATHQQFLMSKRLDALNEVATAMSDVTTKYFYYTGIKKDVPEKEAYDDYGNALDKSGKAIDRGEILFPLAMRGDMERYQAVHRAAWRIGVQKCGGKEYRDFFKSLSREFDKICFETLTNSKDLKGQDKNRMPLTFNSDDRDGMTSDVYLKKQYEHWTTTDVGKSARKKK